MDFSYLCYCFADSQLDTFRYYRFFKTGSVFPEDVRLHRGSGLAVLSEKLRRYPDFVLRFLNAAFKETVREKNSVSSGSQDGTFRVGFNFFGGLSGRRILQSVFVL